MERKMLNLKLQDKMPCSVIRKRTKINDIVEYTLKQKWRWAGHIARMKDNRWTKRCTDWQPRRGKRSRGRPSRRWQDDIASEEGTTWNRKATEDNGRHCWRATSCSGWTKPRCNVGCVRLKVKPLTWSWSCLCSLYRCRQPTSEWTRKTLRTNSCCWPLRERMNSLPPCLLNSRRYVWLPSSLSSVYLSPCVNDWLYACLFVFPLYLCVSLLSVGVYRGWVLYWNRWYSKYRCCCYCFMCASAADSGTLSVCLASLLFVCHSCYFCCRYGNYSIYPAFPLNALIIFLLDFLGYFLSIVVVAGLYSR